MTRRFFLGLLLLATQCAAPAQKGKSDLYSFTVRKIKNGIYMAYRPEPLRKFVEGNVTIIINDKDVVLVDGGGSATSARNIISEVRKLTKNPIRYVINTHPHADHTLGNEEYVRSIPGVEIISHTLTRKDMIEKIPPFLQTFSKNLDELRKGELELIDEVEKEAKPGHEKVTAYLARYANMDIFERRNAYAHIQISPATLLCDQKMVLNRGSRTIEILFIGKGDTPGDLVVYLPQDKVVCSGDMVVHPFPYGFSKNPAEWVETLKKLSGLDFDFLVPGHGALQSGKSYVTDVIDLIRYVHDQTKIAAGLGATKETIQNSIDLSSFANKYLNNDPVTLYRFKRWFSNPAIEEAYKIYAPKKESSDAGYEMFRGNMLHTGIYPGPETKINPSLKWRFRTNGYVNASPAIEGNKIFFGSGDGFLYCLNLQDGSLVWKFKTGGAVYASPAVVNNEVYFGSHDGNFYSLNANNGQVRWVHKTGGEKLYPPKELWARLGVNDPDRWDTWLSSPVVKNTTVYVGSGDGNFYALERSSGKEKWKFRTNGSIHSSPAIAAGTIYFGGWDTYLHALDEETGAEKWKFKTGDDTLAYNQTGITSSPVIVGNILYFGCRDSHIYALDATTGKLIWKRYNDNIWVSGVPLVYEDKVIYSAGRPNKFIALNRFTGDSIYKHPTKTSVHASVSLAGKTLYYGDMNGILNARDVASGNLIWTYQLPTSQEDSLHMINKDFTTNQEGFAAALEKYKGVKGRNEVRFSLGAIHSSPVIKNGVVYFGSTDGYLYALE